MPRKKVVKKKVVKKKAAPKRATTEEIFSEIEERPEGQKVTYNPSTKTDDIMEVTEVYKQPIMKEGKKTGKYRYRVQGIFPSTDTGVSRLVSESEAKSHAEALGISIKEQKVKTAAEKAAAKKEAAKKAAARRGRKSCKQIGEDAEDRCLKRRGEK